MSHFLTLVLVNRDVVQNEFKSIDLDNPEVREFIEGKVGMMLEPYSENLEVESHSVKCHCVNNIATMHGHNEAEKVKELKTLRKEYCGKHPDDRPEWDEFTKEWDEVKERETKAHPLYMKPDPDCETCNGTGNRMTPSNPKGKWDWWAIGGRWTGELTDYDPAKDPANTETCDLCHGTGVRTDMIVQNGCNGCVGTGKSLKWPTQWKKYNGDMRLLSAIKKDTSSFAIVTPDGEWHEQGEMGWFGCVSNEDAAWSVKQKALIEKYKDCIVVACDMHV